MGVDNQASNVTSNLVKENLRHIPTKPKKMILSLFVLFGASLICGVLSTPPAPANFSCQRGSAAGSVSCSWDAVSEIDDADEALGYPVRFWTEGDEFDTRDEADFPATATSGVFTSSASANDKLAVEIRLYTKYYEGETSSTVLVPMGESA